jgi:hypothetical protein
LNDDIALIRFALFMLLLPDDDRRRVVYGEIKEMRGGYTPRPHKIVNGAKKLKFDASTSYQSPRYGEHEVYHNFF